MFNDATGYILATIGNRISAKKKDLKLKREQILPRRVQRLSRILNNKISADYPNLLSMALAEEIADNMSSSKFRAGFIDVSDLLWGGIDWVRLAHICLAEIDTPTGESVECVKLKTLLDECLIGFVPYAQIQALIDSGADESVFSAYQYDEKFIVKIRNEAIEWVFFRNISLDTTGSPWIVNNSTFITRFHDSFYKRFNDTGISKFNMHFPSYLTKFLSNELTTLTPSPSSFGFQAYNLQKNAIGTADDIMLNFQNQKNSDNLNDYMKFIGQTINQLTGFQKKLQY